MLMVLLVPAPVYFNIHKGGKGTLWSLSVLRIQPKSRRGVCLMANPFFTLHSIGLNAHNNSPLRLLADLGALFITLVFVALYHL